MKRFLFLSLIALMGNFVFAQDIIYKQNGDQIKSKVLEISAESIKYKEFDFQDGPLRVISVKEVNMIVYQNGKKEVISGEKKQINLPFFKNKNSSNNSKTEPQKETAVQQTVTKPEAQKEVPPQTNVTKPEAKKEATPPPAVSKPAAQKEAPPPPAVSKPAVQKEAPPQTSASKPVAQKEVPPPSGTIKTETQTQAPVQKENDQSVVAGIWKSKTLGDAELAVTNEGFKIQYPGTNGWIYYKPIKHPEYVCYQVDNNKWKGYISTKIIFVKSDRFELNYYGNPHYFSLPQKVAERKKLSSDDIPLINGFWRTVSDKVFAVPSTFEAVTANGEFKITNTEDINLWAQFRVTTFPEFECYQVNGKKMQSYQGSKATIEDIDNIEIGKPGEKEKLKLIRTRYYSVNDAGELYVNRIKIAIIKKTASGSVMYTTMPEFTVYDINNKPWIRYTSEGKYLFLDDNKSFIPRQSDAHIAGEFGIAQFFAREDILTAEGFNNAYRATFIEKYEGYNATPGTKENIRNRSLGVTVKGGIIRQGDAIIGYLEYVKASYDGSAETIVKVLDFDKKLIARIGVSAKSNYNQVTVKIFLGNNSSVERTYTEMWSLSNVDDAVKWLVERNHL